MSAPTTSYTIGGARQASIFALMKAGASIVITGAGGTGKTAFISRYIAYLREQTDDAIHRFALHNTGSDDRVTLYGIDAFSTAMTHCLEATAAGRRCVAIIDEYTLVHTRDYRLLEAYDQVIATGDPAQDCVADYIDPAAFPQFLTARGAISFQFDRVWRSHHLPVSTMLNYHAYGGRLKITPSASRTVPDIHRSTCVPPGPEFAALAIFARITRAQSSSARFSHTIALRDPTTKALLKKMMLLPGYDEKVKSNHDIVDPTFMQGLETDVLIVNCADFDKIYRTPDSIVRAAFTTIGRARTRTEFVFTYQDEMPPGRLTFSLFIKMLLADIPEQRNTDPAYAQLEARMGQRGVDLIPVDNGVLLYDRAKNASFHLIRHADPEDAEAAIETLYDASRLKALGWIKSEVKPRSLAAIIDDDEIAIRLAAP